MDYTVDYFIEKFEKIPEEKWITGLYEDINGNHCALGWCGVKGDANDESAELTRLFWKIDKSVIRVNDGILYAEYQQSTPKQRILAALRDIKSKMESNG